MRFLLDQSTDARLVAYLRRLGHDAIRVGRDLPSGLTDLDVLAQAAMSEHVLITDDRDFGELVFRHRQPHTGVIYLRLGPDADLPFKIERLEHVLTHHVGELRHFLVVTRHNVRIRTAGDDTR